MWGVGQCQMDQSAKKAVRKSRTKRGVEADVQADLDVPMENAFLVHVVQALHELPHV